MGGFLPLGHCYSPELARAHWPYSRPSHQFVQSLDDCEQWMGWEDLVEEQQLNFAEDVSQKLPLSGHSKSRHDARNINNLYKDV